MSTNPGVTIRPRASTSSAPRPGTEPTAAMRSPLIATSPSNGGAPEPSKMAPPRRRRLPGQGRLHALADRAQAPLDLAEKLAFGEDVERVVADRGQRHLR